jgi:hypothetical protein
MQRSNYIYVILTFDDLLNFSTLYSLEKSCKDLKKNTSTEVLRDLLPFTIYHISLYAYNNGKVKRNGNAVSCSIQTKEARKSYDFIHASFHEQQGAQHELLGLSNTSILKASSEIHVDWAHFLYVGVIITLNKIT